MNEDKLKELEEFIETKLRRFTGGGEPDTLGLPSDHFDEWRDKTLAVVPDLIKYVRQLEKDNAENKEIAMGYIDSEQELQQANTELLAALKPANDAYRKATAEMLVEGESTGTITLLEITAMAQAYNKHKGE